MICGVHAVYEVLSAGRPPVERIHVLRDARLPRLKQILDLARERGVPVRKEERSVLDKIAGGVVHQGIVAIAGEASYAPLEKALEAAVPCVVVLDGVEDPHNLGAVIRTAEASGVSGVIVPERHAAPLTATVAKASAGALAYVPVVRVGNLATALEQMKKRGIWVVGVDEEGDRLWTEFDYTGPVALVFGGEHKGLRRLVREHCDVVVRLPMLGKVEALNVSVAAGVVLYEVVRQRGLAGTGKAPDKT
ncbi:MAG TPA: 23S rRNA (guanosine(2251)-2'-O)-methyltransferase RlmB [Terriglobia bacterium]|nr:23S rRNA (guanosine(2251)-2'-O)-methyltransferase RlmB [Terriglobia bacterium]